MDGYACCLKKLQKVYSAVEKQVNRAKEAHEHSCTLVRSLTNLFEQLSACNKVSFNREPLAEFEGLQERLRYKLIAASEDGLKKIQDDLNILRDVSRKLSEFRKTSFDVYTQHALQGNLTIEEAITGMPTCPSISHMLEWLVKLDKSYAELYEEKLEIIENVTYNDLQQSRLELRKWKVEGQLPYIEGFSTSTASFSFFP